MNIDGASNRVSSLLHGPKHVVIVAGINKIVKTVEDGIHRIQTQTCPVIADKTGRKTPCGTAGFCTDCQSPDCMCCNIVVTRRSRYTGRKAAGMWAKRHPPRTASPLAACPR